MGVEIFRIVREAAKLNHYKMYKRLELYSQSSYKTLEEDSQRCDPDTLTKLYDLAASELNWTAERFMKELKKSLANDKAKK